MTWQYPGGSFCSMDIRFPAETSEFQRTAMEIKQPSDLRSLHCGARV
jgi:hypothetical protein